MADDIILYTHPMSRGRTARWMLEEVGAPYRAEVLDYGGSMSAAPYLAINPMAKVPALVHGAAVVTETAAICAYLADAFPEAGLAPPLASPARAPYLRWLFFAAGPLEAAWTTATLGFEVPPEKSRMVGYGSFALVIDTLEHAVAKAPTLAGDAFSAADLYLSAQLAFGMRFGMIEKRPAFVAYVDRATNRPAAIRARALDDALIPPAEG